MDASTVADMTLQMLFCDFLAGSLLTVMARGEDQIKTQVSAIFCQNVQFGGKAECSSSNTIWGSANTQMIFERVYKDSSADWKVAQEVTSLASTPVF